MFDGIRSRLLASYFLLLLMTLVIMLVSLLVFLSARPAVSEEQVLRNIARFATQTLERHPPRAILMPLLSDSPSIDAMPFSEFANRNNVRILLLDDSNDHPTVIEDSFGQFTANDQPDIRSMEPFQLRDNPPRGQRGPQEIVTRGHFVEDSDDWIFIAIQPTPLRERVAQDNILLLAQVRSTTPLLGAIQQILGDNLGTALLQAAVVGTVVAITMAIVITRTIANPLQHMAKAAAEVAEGNYGKRVDAVGPKEIRDMALAFNRMSEQVELNNQAQRDLMANVSHDLKTPLTSIQGFSQAIMEGATQDPTKAASIIYDEAGRLTRLVEQLTELARLKAGRLAMRQDNLDVATMVDALAQKIDVVAQKKNIKLHTDITPVPAIKGDGDRLAQVITNLLSNAVKYTPSGGQVLAAVNKNGNGVNIIVQDNGIGIPEEDVSRVFERFYQVDKARGPQRGHGLGLAITHEIVEAHGGKITVSSKGQGKGTTFAVWLPHSAH